jgi:hypothetical protein
LERGAFRDPLIELSEPLIPLLKAHTKKGEAVFRGCVLLGIAREIGFNVVIATFSIQRRELT